MLKNIIFTACDAKYGDFLADHWLKSLRENVDCSNIDIVILDYGLNEKQKERLNGVKIVKCERDGHVVNIRYRDMKKYLENHTYDQVLSIDGGDIIFQSDINNEFERHKNKFRAVFEDFYLPFAEFFSSDCFSKTDAKKFREFFKDKKTLNGGVVFAPANKFVELCDYVVTTIQNMSRYGPDQIAMNYFMLNHDFKALDSDYNFAIHTTRRKFKIRNGIFYDKNDHKIPIVHNIGYFSWYRPIRNFGYGHDRNQLKIPLFYLTRMLYLMMHVIKSHKKSK